MIGDDNDVCPYALNLNNNSVIKTSKGDFNREPLESYENFDAFMDELHRAYTETLDDKLSTGCCVTLILIPTILLTIIYKTIL